MHKKEVYIYIRICVYFFLFVCIFQPHLSICLCLPLCVGVCVSMPIYLFVCLLCIYSCIFLSVTAFIYIYIYISLCLAVCVCVHACLFIRLFHDSQKWFSLLNENSHISHWFSSSFICCQNVSYFFIINFYHFSCLFSSISIRLNFFSRDFIFY